MTRQPDNRIERDFLDLGLSKALDDVEAHWRARRTELYPAASLILTGNGLKFFSNGLVLDKALDDKMFFAGVLDPFILRLSSFPLPTIAAVNGHAFAMGFVLALCCDYLVGKKTGRGWFCMNENEFASTIPPGMLNVLSRRLNNWKLIRETILNCKRWTPPQLHEIGLIDVLCSEEELESESIKLGKSVGKYAQKGSYGLLKHNYCTL
ncbi:putative enoyl-CoA hydratase [Wallemia mellicola]|nr:putative enoyl-CoA hydratase [Wallemia mellicola]